MVVCKYCKKEKPDDGFKMCQSCRKKHSDREAEYKKRVRNGERIRKYEKKPQKQKHNSNLDKILKELREYNEKHGTRLTYGKYMELVLMGKV